MSTSPTLRLLLSGDLHIGRASTRVPETVRRNDVRAATAWERMVDLALDEKADVILLSGDVADEENKFWEAIGPLERGVRRLAEAGGRTVAVAGNHDHDALLRLAEALPETDFTLLGRGGTWQRLKLQKDGRTALIVDGWSFPRARAEKSPLDTYDLPASQTAPILGLVHGDLDKPASPYAPLDLARLRALPPAGWLLGHVHAPRLVAGDAGPWVLYPGSPQALDPGETGVHGPWIVDVTSATLGVPEHRPLSSVVYHLGEVDLDGVATEDRLESLLLDTVRREADVVVREAGDHLVHVSLRLRLHGTTPIAHRVAEITERAREDLALNVGSASVGVDAVEVDVTPAIDLDEYAATPSAPGLVARLLRELEASKGSTETTRLLRAARDELESVFGYKDFAALERRELDDDTVRHVLRGEARALLARLVEQTS